MISALAFWRYEIAAGAIASIVSLPVCIASGVLAFAPLGPRYAAIGAGAGLCGAIVAGAVSSLVSTSSFIITSPRVSESLLLASLIITLSALPGVFGDKDLVIVSVYLCVLLAGLWQVIFGLVGVAKVIKFTPHPVLVGFLNGVAVLVVLSQLTPYFQPSTEAANLILFDRPLMFLSMLGVAALMLAYPTIARTLQSSWSLAKVPAILAAFVGGIVMFYLIKGVRSDLDLGPTVGHMTFDSPLIDAFSMESWKGIAHVGGNIISISFILAIIATMDTLLAFRTTQNLSDVHVSPVRDLVAQGVGNCASAIAGGVTSAVSPSPTMAAYQSGGRTRVTPLSSALILLALAVFFPSTLADIPSVVLSGILLAVGILLFDRWIIQVVLDTRDAASPVDRRRCIYDLTVVVIVMGTTVFYSIVAGVIAGCLLSGLVFIVNMSRPIVRRIFLGHEIQSKRLRSAQDMLILRETGAQRAVLQLEGVLFFGNADDLSAKVKSLFQIADLITLDLRGVSDIDVSGANILANLVSKSRELKKYLVFCHVPSTHIGLMSRLVPKGTATDEVIRHDLDSTLEWMEEKSLLLHAGRRSQADVLALGEIDFLVGLEEHHLHQLRGVLTWREFAANEIICREGDEGDRMWLLAKGSVSVRLISSDGSQNLRIASLARGTTVGEMSLIEVARRSATIVADEQVVCYEFLRDNFHKLLSDSPDIATRLLSNLARELSRRLRRTSEDLRNRS